MNTISFMEYWIKFIHSYTLGLPSIIPISVYCPIAHCPLSWMIYQSIRDIFNVRQSKSTSNLICEVMWPS